jgi:hypothetical protein
MDKIDKPRIYVDFNEMLAPDLFLLSKSDTKADSSGNQIQLFEGKKISIYSDDLNDQGQIDYLIAEAIVERNSETTGWSAVIKWCCRVDKNGIRHASELH